MPLRSFGRTRPVRILYAAAVVGVIVALVVVGAGFGWFGQRFAFWRPNSPHNEFTFLDALSVSDQRATEISAGPWNLTFAEAEQSSVVIPGSTAPTDPENCTFNGPVPDVPADMEVLLASGLARYWSFTYLGVGGSYLWINVVDGAATVSQWSAAAADCGPTGHVPSLNGSSLVDSPQVVSALGADLTAYLENHTVLNAFLVLENTGIWTALASACPWAGNITGLLPSGPDFEGDVNGTSLRVLAERAYGPSSCS